jgi:hypothetical protein
MKNKISLRQRTFNCLTINGYFDLFRVEFGSQLSDLMAIHGNSSIHDELVGSTAASNSGIGNNLIKAHLGHVAIHSRQSTAPKDEGAGGEESLRRYLVS